MCVQLPIYGRNKKNPFSVAQSHRNVFASVWLGNYFPKIASDFDNSIVGILSLLAARWDVREIGTKWGFADKEIMSFESIETIFVDAIISASFDHGNFKLWNDNIAESKLKTPFLP